MKHGRSGVRLVAVVATVALLAAGCGGRDDNADSSSDNSGDTRSDTKSDTRSDTKSDTKTVARVPGFDGTTIKLGVLTPLSGAVAAPIGRPSTAGGDVYWQALNAKGGVAGKYKIELIKEDTLYDPDQTKQKYTTIKDEVVMFSQILGTPPTQAVLQDLKTDGLAASPASLDAAWVREPNLLPIGSTYQLQFINAASYLLDELRFKGKTMCIIAEEGAQGDAGIAGLDFAAKELEFRVAAKARFKATDRDVTAPLIQLKNANCAAVFITATPSNTGKIVGTGAQLRFDPQWIGQSLTWVSSLAASPVGPVLEKSFLLTTEGAEWGDESVRGMKQMLEDIKQYKADQQPDVYFSFGYVQALAVHDVLERAVENGDLSRKGILKAIEEAEPDYRGLLGDYKYGKASEREPSRTTAIFKVDKSVPGALKKVKDITSDAAKAYKFA